MLFTPIKESEGIIFYFADKTNEEGNHFSLIHQQRCMNSNQAECEWNTAGDRAVIKISSDVDRVGMNAIFNN